MTMSFPSLANDARLPVTVPDWLRLGSDSQPEHAAFAAGSALTVLHGVLRDPEERLPLALLRDRLAMQAAIACLKLERRGDGQADIRDAICLTRPGDALGPAGEMFARWRDLTRIGPPRSSRLQRLEKVLPEAFLADLPGWFDASMREGRTPVGPSVAMLRTVLRAHPTAECEALMLADLILAMRLNWTHAVPMLSVHLRGAELRRIAAGEADGEDICHRAVFAGVEQTLVLAADLTRRAERLLAVAPKLRAKGSEAAVSLFLSEDAVSPSGALSPIIRGSRMRMSDRAARRFCERLIELDVVRELTGRTTFRLYGL